MYESKGFVASCVDKVYGGTGNPDLVELLDPGARTILDVGCGVGTNASLIRQRAPDVRLYGITLSPSERERAAGVMEACWVADIERGMPPEVRRRTFDAIVFSHVLEHVRDPGGVVAEFSALLAPRGSLLIAVPNVLNWRDRFRFLAGRFEYSQAGTLDYTHLRFFTVSSAPRILLSRARGLELRHLSVGGHLPLGPFRTVLPRRVTAALDRLARRHAPGLLGHQILVVLRKPD